MYDIDNKKIPTDKELTVEEATNLINHYKDLADKEEDNHKKGVYTTYIKNLNAWLFRNYINNPQEFIKNAISKTDKNVIEKAINELSEELSDDNTTRERITEEIRRAVSENNENSTDEELGNDVPGQRDESSVPEERTITQSDLLVSREPANEVSDEYVEYEEVA